jgi:siroheme synthase
MVRRGQIKAIRLEDGLPLHIEEGAREVEAVTRVSVKFDVISGAKVLINDACVELHDGVPF